VVFQGNEQLTSRRAFKAIATAAGSGFITMLVCADQEKTRRFYEDVLGCL